MRFEAPVLHLTQGVSGIRNNGSKGGLMKWLITRMAITTMHSCLLNHQCMKVGLLLAVSFVLVKSVNLNPKKSLRLRVFW